MTHLKTFQYYEDFLQDLDYGSDSPEDKARYLGVRPIGTGDVLEIPYRHYWELRKVKKLLPRKRPLRILELGCGAGRFAISLASIASKITAVDFSKVQLETGIQDCKNAGIQNVEFINASVLDHMPEPGDVFDVVYFSSVCQYLSREEILQILERIRPFLAPDAVIIERSTIVKNTGSFVSETDHYFSIFRTSDEILEIFADAQYTGCEVGPSYQYLRFQKLWRIGAVRHGIKLLIRICPGIAYRGMALISWCCDLFCGKGSQLPEKKGYAIHTYFKFSPSLSEGAAE